MDFDNIRQSFPYLCAFVVIFVGVQPGSSFAGIAAPLSPGKSGLDIILMVDTSASIGERSLQSAKDFMKILVDVFGVSDKASGGVNGTRFALVTFSSDATIVFNLDDGTARNKEAVKRKIDGITNSGGGTDFRKAFLTAAFRIYVLKMRLDVARTTSATRAIFLITDGEETSNLQADSIQEIRKISDQLKSEFNFKIFTIGIGININRSLLAKFASKPEAEHLFLINQYKDLQKIVKIISGQKIDYGQCGISGNTEMPLQDSQTVAKGAWPWLGWLIAVSDFSKPKSCGGALLCDRWFMTAASCVSNVVNGFVVPNKPTEVNVFLSQHRLTDFNDNDIVYAVVQNIRIHDNYTGNVIGDHGVRMNDVALIDLGEKKYMRPNLGKYLRPICFPVNITRVQANAELRTMLYFPYANRGYTAGWGHSPDNTEHVFTKFPFDELRQNERLLLKSRVCKKRYIDIDIDRFFCVANDHKESDSCVGDIGGPYMVKMTNMRYVAMGLALNTRGCDEIEKHHISIFLNLIHTDVSTWAESILDGCNRVEEIGLGTNGQSLVDCK